MTEDRSEPAITSPPVQVDRARNRRLGLALSGLVCGMVGLSFASVPLYDLFCRVTGFGGTTQVATQAADHILDRTVTIRFNADVNRDLPWAFHPVQKTMKVRLGESALTAYSARNLTARPIVGNATYNVTPEKAGIYFNKVQCFCFTEQVLAAGQEVDMPVYFFVDPAMADDPNMADVTTITLSYTFYQAPDQSGAKQALDAGRAKDYQETAQAGQLPDRNPGVK